MVREQKLGIEGRIERATLENIHKDSHEKPEYAGDTDNHAFRPERGSDEDSAVKRKDGHLDQRDGEGVGKNSRHE